MNGKQAKKLRRMSAEITKDMYLFQRPGGTFVYDGLLRVYRVLKSIYKRTPRPKRHRLLKTWRRASCGG